MSSFFGPTTCREAPAQRRDDLGGLVDRERRLRDVRQPASVGSSSASASATSCTRMVVRRLAHRADDLLVSGVADQEHGVAGGRVALRLDVMPGSDAGTVVLSTRTVASATSSMLACTSHCLPGTTMLYLQDHALDHHILFVQRIEQAAQHGFVHFVADLDGVIAIHDHLGLDRLGAKDTRMVAISERSLIASAHDDPAAGQALALQAQELVDHAHVDQYVTSAIALAVAARAALRHGRWDQARAHLAEAERVRPLLGQGLFPGSPFRRSSSSRAPTSLWGTLERTRSWRRSVTCWSIIPTSESSLTRPMSWRPTSRPCPSTVTARPPGSPGPSFGCCRSFDPPLVPRDRRGAVRLPEHHQDPGNLGVPEARRVQPKRRDRPRRPARPRRDEQARELNFTRGGMPGAGCAARIGLLLCKSTR